MRLPDAGRRDSGPGRLISNPRQDRAGACCGPWPAMRRHGRDWEIRFRWATRDRSRRASVEHRRDAPAADRSSHAHNGPADGNRAITGSNRLFLSR